MKDLWYFNALSWEMLRNKKKQEKKRKQEKKKTDNTYATPRSVNANVKYTYLIITHAANGGIS